MKTQLEISSNNKRPMLIVLTPIRNEAWILPAFLSATSLWADLIIIADQMSTDGSREIAQSFDKVRLINNNRADIHMGDVRCMLMEEARKIEGEKILITLDADEFWAGDFTNTETWHKILTSEPDDVFEFKWMNLLPNLKQYLLEPQIHFNWVIHASEAFFNGKYPENRFIHEWRLRWSPNTTSEKEFECDDIRALHFCFVNPIRLQNKWNYYAVSSVAIPNNVYNMVSLYRQYHTLQDNKNIHSVPHDAFDWYKKRGIDVLNLIDFNDIGQYYIDRILFYIKRDGTKKYAILDIWNNDFCKKYNLKDPRNIFHKLIHLYLRSTTKYSNSKIIKFIDKIVKIITKLMPRKFNLEVQKK